MNKTKQLSLSSMFLALGVLFPQFFHAIPNAGNIFLPMHIPVLICGFVCGPIYGLLVGLLTPILSYLIFAMPSTIMLSQMVIELSVYGFLTGLLNKKIHLPNALLKNYLVLLSSMIIGRLIYGVTNTLIFQTTSYSFSIWLTSAFITGIPGIIIQLIIIPILIKKIS